MPWKTVEDRFREIWSADATLNAAIPVTTLESTNRFFADGFPDWITDGANYPNEFVTLEDFGDGLAAAANDFETRIGSYLLRICTKSKELTKTLYETYFPLLRDQLPCSETDLGSICSYRVVSQQLSKLDGGLRVYQAQLSVTLRKART